MIIITNQIIFDLILIEIKFLNSFKWTDQSFFEMETRNRKEQK